jgi:antitoxin component YwqK of YwqJK toxin-antitoxin module
MVRTTNQRHFYRSGLLREEIPFRNGQRHGVHRTWHKNGVLASEEPYVNGLLHGICRQRDEAGRLLGKYRMVRGTGIQRAWHENGQLQMEVSTVRGEFCGRNRIGSAMFVMGNSLERGLNRNCNDTRKTISAAFGAG